VAHGRLLRFATVSAVFVLALACAACGRRGPLLEPPSAQPPAASSTNAAAQKPSRPKRTPISRPEGPFILDPLL
jgi:predicted small lipoprotein YifL